MAMGLCVYKNNPANGEGENQGSAIGQGGRYPLSTRVCMSLKYHDNHFVLYFD